MKLSPSPSKRETHFLKTRTRVLRSLRFFGFGATLFTLSGVPASTISASEFEDSLGSERKREIEEIRLKIVHLNNRKEELLYCIDNPNDCTENGYYDLDFDRRGVQRELLPSE